MTVKQLMRVLTKADPNAVVLTKRSCWPGEEAKRVTRATLGVMMNEDYFGRRTAESAYSQDEVHAAMHESPAVCLWLKDV